MKFHCILGYTFFWQRGIQYLISSIRDRPNLVPPAVEAWGLNHLTTRDKCLKTTVVKITTMQCE